MKTKVKFYALLLAVALFFASLFGLGGVLRANAEGLPAGSENEPSLYYITDRAESKEYFNSIGDAAPIPEEQKHFIYIQPQDFWNVMRQMYQSEYFFGIKNAFFVLEVRSGFPQDVLTPQNEDEECFSDQIFIMLYEIFDFLRFNGCKSMFICGTDEARFSGNGKSLPYPRNEFLKNVDIHVNSDLRTMYHYTAIKRMEQTLCGTQGEPQGNDWRDTTIVLDVSLGDSWWFYKTLILYFVTTYHSQKQFSSLMPEIILEEMGVNVFFYQPGGGYANPITSAYVSEDYFMQTWKDAQHGFVITGLPIPENQRLWDLEDERSGATYLYTFDYNANLLDVQLPDIMYDFIFDNDLSNYQNYPGRCLITHKTVRSSENGWLYIPVYMPWLDLVIDLGDAEKFPQELDGLKELVEFLNSAPPDFAFWDN